jgi:hypothetical protein
MLGELEQVVMLAALRLGDDAYGVAIQAAIRRATGRDLTLGTGLKLLRASIAALKRMAAGLAVGLEPS